MNDVTNPAIVNVDLEQMRDTIADSESRWSDAAANIKMADNAIADLHKQLEGWERYRGYQARRQGAIELRIRSEREELRAAEDFRSNV